MAVYNNDYTHTGINAFCIHRLASLWYGHGTLDIITLTNKLQLQVKKHCEVIIKLITVVAIPCISLYTGSDEVIRHVITLLFGTLIMRD